MSPIEGSVVVYNGDRKRYVPSEVTLEDLEGGSGGGGSSTLPDPTAPVTPNAQDDEFTGPGLDPKWTVTTPATKVAPIVTVEDGRLIFEAARQEGFGITGLTQPLPSGDFLATLDVEGLDSVTADYTTGALIGVAAGATGETNGQMYFGGLGRFNGGNQLLVTHANSWVSHNDNRYSGGPSGHASHGYLRVKKVGDTYTFQFSNTGRRFANLWSGTLPFTPARLVIGASSDGYPASHRSTFVARSFRVTSLNPA